MFVLYGDKECVKDFVVSRIEGMLPYDRHLDDYQALGVVDAAGKLVAGVVYDQFTGYSIAMHVAAISGTMWLRPKVLRELFGFPFNQLKCRRVTGYVAAERAHTVEFDLKLGFKIEGVMRDATPNGDMVILGMTRNECRWLGDNDGQVLT